MIREYMERMTQTMEEKIEIESFLDGDEIVREYKANFDIILMDIQMKFMDGLSAARFIRERDNEVVIIFVTNMAQYAIHGYEVNAFDYILKPLNYFSFSEKIHRAMERMDRKSQNYLKISVDRGLAKINIAKLRYIESQGHKIIFYAGDKEYSTHSLTMKSLEEKLEKFNFYRCNKGFLVNLEYVEGIEDGCAIVGDQKILISRLKKAEFMEVLTNYIGDRIK